MEYGLTVPPHKVYPPQTLVKAVNVENFNTDIESMQLQDSIPAHVDDMVTRCNSALRGLLDNHAPVKTISIVKGPSQPWINELILKAKRQHRQVELRWRRSVLAADRAGTRRSVSM